MVIYESSSGRNHHRLVLPAPVLVARGPLEARDHLHRRRPSRSPGSAPSRSATDLEEHTRVVSPTYQQIHLEQDKAKGVVRAFLVGQSGPHHFSAAFEVAERPHGAVIDVDVADRCRAPVEYLAATYAVEPSPGTWTSEDHARSDPDATFDPAVAARTALVLTCEHPHSSPDLRGRRPRPARRRGSRPRRRPRPGAGPHRRRRPDPPVPLPLALGQRPPRRSGTDRLMDRHRRIRSPV